MKRKRYKLVIASIAILLGCICSSNIALAATISDEIYERNSIRSVSDPYEGLNKINSKDLFNQNQSDYYVYFYMINCPYCNIVKDSMIQFASERDNVYLADYAIKENRPILRYDWSIAAAKYNKKIGYVDINNVKHYLEGESEAKYENMENEYGKIMKFNFVTIDANNIAKFQEAQIGDIYTDIQTPEINYAGMTHYDELMIAGVPTLLHIKNGRIDAFYFDAIEISDFLNKQEIK